MLEKVAKAHLRNIRVSPRKLNLVAQSIRGLPVSKALASLSMCRKRVAKDVHKLVFSAVANAEFNHGMDVDLLYVDESYVGSALKLRRFQARGRGKSGVIEKPFSHISVVLKQREA